MWLSEALALAVADLDVDRQAIVVARSLEDDGTIGCIDRGLVGVTFGRPTERALT